jgi:DNA helicase-2/ATP-dependent DNA helicase PcrA
MELDKQQNEILTIDKGKHVVQAPAGCGKTEILTQRIMRAGATGTNEEEIMCLTFTNKAAAEMKERFQKKSETFKGFIGNIHNYSLEFLKKNNLVSGRITLLNEDENSEIIDGLLKKNIGQEGIKRNDFINFALDYKRGEYKLEPIYKDDFIAWQRNIHYKQLVELYKKYEAIKCKYDFLDFDDLLTLTIYNLKNNHNLKFNQFEWIQVDEAQDLNLAQWEIIDLISNNANCIMLFGDYEQSIYSFMGSEDGRFYSLFKNPSFRIHYLTNNYRSEPDIISTLNTFLKKIINSDVYFSNANNINNSISNNCFRVLEINGSIDRELEYIASNIVKPNLYKYEKIGILCRTNKTADNCGDKLNNIGIDNFKLSGSDIFKNEELKLVFALLNAKINPFDIISWGIVLKAFTTKVEISQARAIINNALNVGLLIADLFEDEICSQYEKFCTAFERDRLIVFDTETTGLNTDNDEIIQIAAIELINGEIAKRFEVFIRQNKPISEEIVNLTKITNEKLNKEGYEAKEAVKMFADFVGNDNTVLAHNLDYDMAMIANFIGKYSDFDLERLIKVKIDSLTIAKLLYPKLTKYKLEYLLEFLELEGVNSHNAMDDVLATISLVKKLYKEATLKRRDYIPFLAENEEIIEEFKKKFCELNDYLNKNYFESVSLASIIEHIVNRRGKSKIVDLNIYQQFIKFVQLQENEYEFKSLRMRLNEDLQKLKTLKESDLINDDAKVIVSTVHKAKGLAFDLVIIAEATDNTYPSYFTSIEKNEEKRKKLIAEDKRLFYVAMSRGKREIIITCHNKYISGYGTIYDRYMTPFLEPICDIYKNEIIK